MDRPNPQTGALRSSVSPAEVGGDIPEDMAMKAALMPPVAGGGTRRDWFLGVGGRGVAFIATIATR
jgi:hypothetical protein